MKEQILHNGSYNSSVGGGAFFVSSGAFSFSDQFGTAVISRIVVSDNVSSTPSTGSNIPSDAYNYAVQFSFGDGITYTSTKMHRALLPLTSRQNPQWTTVGGGDSCVEFGKGIVLQKDFWTDTINTGLYWDVPAAADISFSYNVTIFGTYLVQ